MPGRGVLGLLALITRDCLAYRSNRVFRLGFGFTVVPGVVPVGFGPVVVAVAAGPAGSSPFTMISGSSSFTLALALVLAVG
jgi:hypothetical protein